MRKTLTILFSAALALAMLPASAFAAPVAQPDADAPLAAQPGENIAEGTWGTCPWEISTDGVLTVHPGTGAGTGGTSPWNAYATDIVEVVFRAEDGRKVIAPADCSFLLSGLLCTKAMDFSGFDTANARDMGGMFHACFQGGDFLASLDLSSLDTSNVTDMSNMFARCVMLASLDLSSFDTSNVTDMNAMFHDCASLASLDLSSFGTSKVADMSNMFTGIASLASLDLSSFDTSNVTNAYNVFSSSTSLSSVKVGPKTLANLELPAESVKGHDDWYSKGAGAWFTSEQISAQRRAIADTYLKEESVDDEPGQPDQPGTTDPKPDDGDEPGTTDSIGTQAMYRLYNPNSGEHHYTTSPEERDMLVSVGWTWEDGGWFSDPAEAVPLYRAYNPNAYANNHHYTTDRGEFETLLSLGWRDEGIGWHGVK